MNNSLTEPLLVIENLKKSFGSFIANDHITFEVQKGHVHCLLGENGAGKSTLAKCIYGASKPDSGKIFFKGQEVDFSSPRDAIHAGIGMVHQHFVLAEPMNAVENIIVGEKSSGTLHNIQREKDEIKDLCKLYGISFDLDSPVSQLSVGEQQWIEILKALYVGVDLLLLDEPTAVLTPQEVETLFKIIGKMVKSGISVILITHKLWEVMKISNMVTVLRKGKIISTVTTEGSTKASLAKLLIGRDFDFVVHHEKIESGDPIIEIHGLSVYRDNKSLALDDISLTVHRGEILGLAGVSGNGQPELFDALVGTREATAGSIFLEGNEITNLSPAEIGSRGMASVPPDRLKQGLIKEFTIQENLILGAHGNSPFCSASVLDWKEINNFSKKAITDFGIATMGSEQTVGELSGGNAQKVILARELSHRVKALVASSPTRGLDINAAYYIYDQFLKLLKSNLGILLISEDLDEIFNLSDRIAVIYNGRIMGKFKSDEANIEQIGLLMAGIKEEHDD